MQTVRKCLPLLLCVLLALSACVPSGSEIVATPHSTQTPPPSELN